MDKKTIVKYLNKYSINSNACLMLSKKLIELDNKSSRGWYEKGISLTTLHCYREAKKSFNTALKYAPTDKFSLIYYGIGRLYKQKSAHKKALEWYKKGWAMTENDALGCIYIGSVFFCLGKIDKAKNWYEKSFRCKNNCFEEEDYYELAQVYRSCGNILLARKHYLKSLELNPSMKKVKIALEELDNDNILSEKFIELDNKSSRDWYKRAILLTSLHCYREAKKSFNTALKYTPTDKHRSIYNNIGHLYKQKGDHKKALEWYKKGWKISKNDATGYVFIGSVFFKLGKIDKAKDCYEKAINCKEGCIEEIFYNLAGIYRCIENLSLSKKYYLKALELDPQYKHAEIGLMEINDTLKLSKRLCQS